MNGGSASLSPGEYLLRRVSAYKVDLNVPFPFAPEKFLPTADDTDGISLYREACKTPQALADAGLGKHGYYIIRYTVQELRDMGFTPTPTGPVADGHISLPELSVSARDANKDLADRLAVKLGMAAKKRIALNASKWTP